MKPIATFRLLLFLKVMPWLDREGPYVLLVLGLGFIVYGGHCFLRINNDRRKSSDSLKKNQYSSVATEDAHIPFRDEN